MRSKHFKHIVDVLLGVGLLLLMSYQVTGEAGHEWTGIVMTVLIFRFAAFNPETNSQEEWTLFRLSDAPESASFAQTVSQLQETYGELIPCCIPEWVMMKH